jgi:uncharacterized membrane protein
MTSRPEPPPARARGAAREAQGEAAEKSGDDAADEGALEPAPAHPARPAWFRLVTGLVVGTTVATIAPARLGATLRILAGWDAAALTIGALAWSFIARAGAPTTRAWAASIDPGRRAVGVVLIAASTFSMFATGYGLRDARTCSADGRPLFLVLGLCAVASSWALTHTMYTLRYAHLYYRDGVEREGGLAFPGGHHPAYLDFAYYAFTVGMCFQVSDVSVTTARLRRETLVHALLSFAYNTVILAVAINFAVGSFG